MSRRDWSWRKLSVALAAAGLLAAIIPAARAVTSAGTADPKLVTLVARVCPTYEDVTANLARNNIMESLKNLGADTLYLSGQPIDPDLEAKGQPNCTPLLPHWQFTLGTGYQTRAVSGPWGSLSIVTDPFSTHIETEAETALLNDQGADTGRTIAGATTIELTPEQEQLAAQSSRLWVQGGTPDDPILDKTYPGAYGFAALRCGIDNLNGDNVEYITYPSGASHVFCYAYYVQPPPTSGTIIVRKEVASPAGATAAFPFHGNISFEADHRFSLNVQNGGPASITFYRAGGVHWNFTEDVPPGWFLTNLACNSKDGTSTTTTSLTAASTDVALANGDTVTCTYTDSQTPPSGSLQITKVTHGGVGTFQYAVTSASGATAGQATATTSKPDVEVAAAPETIPLPDGTYHIAETLPTADNGHWKLRSVVCNGQQLPATSPVTVTIQSGAGVACKFVNAFLSIGSITVRKRTYGNVGTASFNIYPQAPQLANVVYSKTAKVEQQGVDVLATGDPTNALPLGTYVIQEFAAAGTHPEGWALTSVICNGRLLGSSQGAVTIKLTRREPKVDCTFTNTFTPPPSPPSPSPEPEPEPGPDPQPVAKIEVTKTADRTKVEVGDVVTYTIRVTNTGKVPAQDVVVAEKTPVTTATILSIKPGQGTCTFAHAPASCMLGTIDAGQTVTITARLQATRVGAMPNSVAVNSATKTLRPPTGDVAGIVVKRPKPKPKPKPSHPRPHPAPPVTG